MAVKEQASSGHILNARAEYKLSFADNESALHSLLDTSLHSSHIMSVLSAKRAREWLEAEPNHTIHLHWIPGHRGIALNELVDRLTNEAYDLFVPINRISHAHARALITQRVMEDWAKIPAIGKSFFPPHLRKMRSTTKGGPVLSHTGGSVDLTTRLTRLITNHGPIGEYRSVYFQTESSQCSRCGVLETRRHIVNSCPLYIRPHRDFYQRILSAKKPIPILTSFLEKNPHAYSFATARPPLQHHPPHDDS